MRTSSFCGSGFRVRAFNTTRSDPVTRGAQGGPGGTTLLSLGQLRPEGCANQTSPSSRAAPRRAGGSAPDASWQRPGRPRSSVGWLSRYAAHSPRLCSCDPGTHPRQKCRTLSAGRAVQLPDADEDADLLSVSCALRVLYTDGNVHPRLLPDLHLPHQLQGGSR